MDNDNTQETRKLPLWKSWLEANMHRLDYGAVIQASEIATYLDLPQNSIEFAFAIHHIRRALRTHGKAFSSRGSNGNSYAVLAPERNADEMQRMQRAAINAMKAGVILGTNTPIETLSEADRRRHEAILERMAARSALLQRNPKKLS